MSRHEPAVREEGAAPQPLRPLQLVALLASLLAGVATALAVMPTLFRHTQTDISRVGVILGVLGESTERPQLAVLGDSVAMSGIDARRLGEKLPGDPLAWNLASTGQSLVESALLTQALGDGVEVVVYVARPRGRSKAPPLLPQKSNAYYLYGFRPDDDTRSLLASVYGDGLTALLSKGAIRQAFEGRWAVRQLLDTQMRMWLRSDLALASAEKDLFHPQRYTKNVDPEVLAPVLAEMRAAHEREAPEVAARDRELLGLLAGERAQRGGSTVVLIPPIHPALLAGERDAYARAVQQVEEVFEGNAHAWVVDASALLREEHFIDPLHPNDAGAALLSDFVGERLAKRDGGAG